MAHLDYFRKEVWVQLLEKGHLVSGAVGILPNVSDTPERTESPTTSLSAVWIFSLWYLRWW